MRERFLRVEATGLHTSELATLLCISESMLARWIVGLLPSDEADVIEVALSLLEMHSRPAVAQALMPTMRLALA